MGKVRLLVADDSALMRQVLRRMIAGDSEIELVAMARDGEDALQKARELRPDVISMDINMPRMDGITALQHVVAEEICPVVMVSSLTQKGAITTFEALELGAFDFVGKPGGTVSSSMDAVAEEYRLKIKTAARSKRLRSLRSSSSPRSAKPATIAPRPAAPRHTKPPSRFGYRAVALGISTGGPSSLQEVLPLLPADLNAAVFLVQHMPANFISTFARRLKDSCKLRVEEVAAGTVVTPGTCYVATGDKHLTVTRKLNGDVVLRTPNYPQTLFMPSVDVMMRSVLEVYGTDTIGVLMTGIGSDGADAMVEISNKGGQTIAESEETAVVYGMPREAAERGGAQVIAPSFEIAAHIAQAVNC